MVVELTKLTRIVISIRSGVLVCGLDKSSSTTDAKKKQLILMDFPLRSLHAAAPSITIESLASALGISSASVLAVKQTQMTEVLVHIESAAFPFVQPNFPKILAIDARYVLYTSLFMNSYLRPHSFS